jgi:hypothetical protein
MPRLPTLRVSALANLAHELRFAPPAAARRLVERAEALALRLDPHAAYDEAFLIHQITGFRPDIPRPATVPGAAAIADLPALIARLCGPAAFDDASLPNGPDAWLSAPQLAARWRVTPRTLQRAARLGLLSRRVGPAQRAQVRYALNVVEHFERLHPRFAPSAASAPPARAPRVPRAPRQTTPAAPPITAPPRPRSATAHLDPARFIRRAVAIARAVPIGGVLAPAVLARRCGRSAHAVSRTIALDLLARLRSLDLRLPEHARAALDTPSARLAALTAPAVRLGLGATGPDTLRDALAPAQPPTTLRPGSPDPATELATELARARARWALLARARETLATIDPLHPSPPLLDRVATDLRWASRLKTELVRAEFPLLLSTLRTYFGDHLDALLDDHLASRRLFDDALIALGASVDRFDPFASPRTDEQPALGQRAAPSRPRSRAPGRLAGPASVALNHVVAPLARTPLARTPLARAAGPAPERARPRALSLASPAASAPATAPSWPRRVDAWQTFLEPDARLRQHLDALAPSQAALLRWRFAWGPTPAETGEAPLTLHDAAARLGLHPNAAANTQRRAWAQAWASARAHAR